jgi:hypothetical protein
LWLKTVFAYEVRAMENRRVRDLMVPLDEYPTISRDATLYDAILAFNAAQKKLPPGRSPYRAVLVVDENGRVIGKLGQLAFLKALEPKFSVIGDLEKLTVAGVSSEFINSMLEHYRLFEDTFTDLCRRGHALRVGDVMNPIDEIVDEDMSLGDAIHKIVLWQQLSLLVMREGKAVGLLRLSDLCDEVARKMKELKP